MGFDWFSKGQEYKMFALQHASMELLSTTMFFGIHLVVLVDCKDHSSPLANKSRFHDLFDSIRRNDTKETEKHFSQLGKRVEWEQKAFNSKKQELHKVRRNRGHRLKNLARAAVKREISEKEPAKVSPEDQVRKEEPLVQDPGCVDEIAGEIRNCIIAEPKEGRSIQEFAMDVHSNWSRLASKREGKLQNQLDGYSAAQLKLLYRQAIEEVEGEFPQEYEQDYDQKKVRWDKKVLATKTGFDLREELRRQKWLWYAEHPPTPRMKKIVKHAEERGLTKGELASGIAKAHRRLSSEDIHDGEALVKLIHDPVVFFRARTVVQSLRAVLEDADIMEQYKPKVPNEHSTHAPPKKDT